MTWFFASLRYFSLAKTMKLCVVSFFNWREHLGLSKMLLLVLCVYHSQILFRGEYRQLFFLIVELSAEHAACIY